MSHEMPVPEMHQHIDISLLAVLIFVVAIATLVGSVVFSSQSRRRMAARAAGIAGMIALAVPVFLVGGYLSARVVNPPDSPRIPVSASDLGIAPQMSHDTIETDRELPAWITEHNQYFVVSSGQWPTVKQAEEDALRKAAAMVKQDFDQAAPAAEPWTLPEHVVRQRAVRRQHLETRQVALLDDPSNLTTMYRQYLQVELSPQVHAQIHPQWRSQVVQRRLLRIGALAGFFVLIPATAATYFHVDNATAGLYRRRLKLAGVSLIVMGGLFASKLIS